MLASIVFTTTKLMRRSVPESVEPGLKPNQPNARMNVPSTTIGDVVPRDRLRLALASNLPMRGPITMAPARPMMPPIAWTTPEPAKSTAPWPRPQLMPALREPAAAPEPVGVDAVGKRDPQTVEAEVLPRPALGHRTGRDRRGGVHEHHHEEEEHHHADVVDRAVQEEALRPEQPVREGAGRVAGGVGRGTEPEPAVQHREAGTERRIPARRDGTVPPVAPAEREPVHPERRGSRAGRS